MGQAWQGTPAQQVGTSQNYNPQQQQLFSQYAQKGPYDITQAPAFGPAQDYIKNLLQSQYNPQQNEELFNQGVVNPALKTYEQQIAPKLRGQYYAPSGVYGSALNRALTQSATELQGGLNALRSNYLMQGQENYANRQQNALGQALGFSQAPGSQQQDFFSQIFGARPISPIVQEAQSGWLQDLTKLIFQLLGQGAEGAGKAVGARLIP